MFEGDSSQYCSFECTCGLFFAVAVVCPGLYIHYGNYPWQPVMTPACCVSTELASQEGHGPRTVACINTHCVYLCLCAPATGIPYKYNSSPVFFYFEVSLLLSLSSLPLSVSGCDARAL